MFRVGLLLGALALPGCGGPEAVPDTGPPVPPDEPALESGPSSPAAEATAARLLAQARDALDRGAHSTALETALEVVRSYSTTPGSSRALILGARAALALDSLPVADSLATRYADILTPADPRRLEALLVAGEARIDGGLVRQGTDALLGIPNDAPDDVFASALGLLRRAAPSLDTQDLEALAAGPDLDRPLGAPLLVELAVARHFRGDEEGAEFAASRALEHAEAEGERRLARAVLEGEVDEALGGPAVVGAMLPSTGSPSLRRAAALIEEGVRVRVAEERPRVRRPVELRVVDDEGFAGPAVQRYRELEAEGAVGLVGPLLPSVLEAVVPARERPIPLISPTARLAGDSAEAVYSLSDADPGAARVLAEYANRAGFLTAALVYPRTEVAQVEARAFTEAFNGVILADLPYDSGATYFEEQLLRVAELRPEALVLPVPARDLEQFAPQVSFFGLDTLNIRVLGTEGWTSTAVLDAVEQRHTDSVMATASRAPGLADSAWNAFVERYETEYQKSLRSPLPALGYDAAGLLLEALGSGVRTPGDLLRALEAVDSFPGATGILAVEDGRVVRRWFPVMVLDRRLVVVDSLTPPPIGPLPPPPPPPDTSQAADTAGVGRIRR